MGYKALICVKHVQLRNVYWVCFFEHIYEIDYYYSNIKVLGKGREGKGREGMGLGGVKFDT
jgi:hypothetical protein